MFSLFFAILISVAGARMSLSYFYYDAVRKDMKPQLRTRHTFVLKGRTRKFLLEFFTLIASCFLRFSRPPLTFSSRCEEETLRPLLISMARVIFLLFSVFWRIVAIKLDVGSFLRAVHRFKRCLTAMGFLVTLHYHITNQQNEHSCHRFPFVPSQFTALLCISAAPSTTAVVAKVLPLPAVVDDNAASEKNRTYWVFPTSCFFVFFSLLRDVLLLFCPAFPLTCSKSSTSWGRLQVRQ